MTMASGTIQGDFSAPGPSHGAPMMVNRLDGSAMANSGNRAKSSICPNASTAQVIGRPRRVETQFATVKRAQVGPGAVRKRYMSYALSIAMIGIRANQAGGKKT